ncbi:MAG: poly-gamma-glutamate hydrolase family protein [Acidimicrobiales bacterium]
MLTDLLRIDGVTEHLELRSSLGFLALHGGSLERGTDAVAEEAARRAGASYYAVRQPEDLRWHLPSTAFDPDASPALATVLEHCEVVVSVHGYGRAGLFTSVLLGGRNRRLARHVADHLQTALPEYDAVAELSRIPRELRGLHPDNPVNRPEGAGVQVELPPRIRGLGPHWDGRRHEWPAGRSPHTEALVAALAAAARSWPITAA